jgi:hypothetical protein
MARADVDMKKLGTAAVALALVVAAAVGAVFGLLGHWRMPPGGQAANVRAVLAVPRPVLQAAPQQDLAQYRQAQQQRLDSLGWVDRAAGVARIPIGDAMDLMASGHAMPGRAAASMPVGSTR